VYRYVTGHADALDPGKIVFASFVSKGFHEFMLNWFAHTQRLGIDNVIVAAFDDETEAGAMQLNTFEYSSIQLNAIEFI
jgi:hypothetical protein